MNINKIKREFNNKVMFPLKCKVVGAYDNFRMWVLCFRMKHCKYKVFIEDCETFAGQVGNGTAYRIFENMMEECYADPYKHGYPLDREREVTGSSVIIGTFVMIIYFLNLKFKMVIGMEQRLNT